MDSEANDSGSDYKIESEHSEDQWIIRLSGSIHSEDCPPLRRVLERAVALQPRAIVIDLSNLEFLSSMVLGIIVWAQIRCRYTKGVVRLVKPNEFVSHLLEITNLAQIFPPFDSVEEACRP